jgi:hypothetical protein
LVAAATYLRLRLRFSSQRPSAGLTDRYGMPEDVPSKVIKTDRLGRQEVYRTDRYGMPIGAPIDEQIIE